MVGEFRVTSGRDGLTLLIYGPRDLTEAKSGVPHAAFSLWGRDSTAPDAENLARFLNAALCAAGGNTEPLEAMITVARSAA